MRLASLVLAVVLCAPALAAGWGRYENARFGYAIDVPGDFAGGDEADNGDGRVFRGGFGTQVLMVFGGNSLDGFEAEVALRKGLATDDGWSLTYEASAPNWAVWSGRRGNRIVYARVISLCGGAQFAMFELEYFAQDAAEVDPLIGRIGRSLVPTGGGRC